MSPHTDKAQVDQNAAVCSLGIKVRFQAIVNTVACARGRASLRASRAGRVRRVLSRGFGWLSRARAILAFSIRTHSQRETWVLHAPRVRLLQES